MLKSLPPVGNPIILTSAEDPEKVFESSFGDRSAYLYRSGTMALAASLVAVREYNCIATPEVLLPAYACPDLVSAVLFAGIRPVLVDLEASTPWMDLDRLKDQVSTNTIAVIATHFLGIPERLESIRMALEGTDVLIIEDSAQLFPTKLSAGVWEGDLVTLSFGRGKPVSLLGGGAVLSLNPYLAKHLPLADEAALRFSNNESGNPRALYKAKAHVYNFLLAPAVYGLLQFAPFLHLGETIYKPLEKMLPFGEKKVRLLAANIDAYCRRERKQEAWLSTMLENIDRNYISDLTAVCEHRSALTLLRYPVLVKNKSLRDRFFDAISKAGLGCSRMYSSPLPAIDGLDGVFQDQDQFPGAIDFSQRLLTLPCHPGVSCRDIDLVGDILSQLI